MQIKKQAFTLIELLVVVLIIGILTAMAVPQYQRAVEKSRMVEAVSMINAIYQAQQIYFLANGKYAKSDEMDLLDIAIPGEIYVSSYSGRIQTHYFVYSPADETGTSLAVAQRLSDAGEIEKNYLIFRDKNGLRCTVRRKATDIQKKLCTELNSKGTL